MKTLVLPDVLARAAQAFFDARYADVLATMTIETANAIEVPLRVHALVIRAAALFALYEYSGARDNALRTQAVTLSGSLTIAANTLPALATPANATAAQDLYFRDKAFWVFGRGQRLGDLRRLVRQYRRTQDNVFPTGPFWKGATYGTDVNFPVTTSENPNPNYHGCIDRNA